MRDLWLYAWMPRFPFLGYRAKIMSTAFLGTHIPLIALVSYFSFQSAPNWRAFFVTLEIALVATLAGTGLTLFVLNELLRPVLKTAQALRAYRDARTPSALPTHFADEVGRLMADAGSTIVYLESVRDVLEHVDAETGLMNRKRLLQSLAQREKTGVFAVGVVRFANLGRVVEALDATQVHNAVKRVAERLGRALPEGAELARIAPAEFAVVLPGDTALKAAAALGDLIARASEDVALSDLTLTPELVCGVAEFPADAQDVGAVLDYAVAAAASANISLPTAFHSPRARRQSVERLRMERELRRGLARDEFRLHYQPVVDLGEARVRGAEALIRWQHPERGMMAPGAFIPAAETSGLIDPMGLWVLQKTCAQIREWSDQGRSGLKVAINLSARQFLDPDLSNHVSQAIDAARIAPSQLEIELTETAAMVDHHHTKRVFTMLRDLGVSIAIDDFGTGYASLSYLRKLPFDKLKIDREFVTDIHKRPASQAICSALIALAKGLNLKVLAEGTETEEEVAYLADRGCRLFQGFYFAKPTPADEFTATIDAITLRATAQQANTPGPRVAYAR